MHKKNTYLRTMLLLRSTIMKTF